MRATVEGGYIDRPSARTARRKSRFEACCFVQSVHKNSSISQTIRPMSLKFSTQVAISSYLHKPALTEKFIFAAHGPFSRRRSHIMPQNCYVITHSSWTFSPLPEQLSSDIYASGMLLPRIIGHSVLYMYTYFGSCYGFHVHVRMASRLQCSV